MRSAPERLTTVVSTKGQVILPKTIRERLRWLPGARLTVEATTEGVVLRPAPAFAETRIEEVFGSLPHAGPPLSLEDMDAAVAAEARRRARD